MFLAEFFVPSTLNTGVRFHNRVKGMFLSLAHFWSINIMFALLSNKASAEMKDCFPFRDVSIFKTISLSLLILLVVLSSGILSLIFLWVWKEELSTRLKPQPRSRQAEDAPWHGGNVNKLSSMSLVLLMVNSLYLFLPANQMSCSFRSPFLFPCLLRSSCRKSTPSLCHTTCLSLPQRDWYCSWASPSDYCCPPRT